MLALIARNLIRRGESVHLIEVEGGEARLQPIGSWDVRGPADERGWWYRVDTYGPSDNRTQVVPGAAVVHCRYAVDSARPWYGLSPLQWARATGTLAANLEARLGEEAGGAVAHLLPVPADGGDGGDDDPLAMLKADIASGRGRTLLVETTAAGWGEGRAAAPDEPALREVAQRLGRGFHACKSKRLRTLKPRLCEAAPPGEREREPRRCRVPGCDGKHEAHGLCRLHYRRARAHSALVRSRPRNHLTAIARPRDPAEPAVTGAARRRGEVRRAIEDKEAELHLARMLRDDDW